MNTERKDIKEQDLWLLSFLTRYFCSLTEGYATDRLCRKKLVTRKLHTVFPKWSFAVKKVIKALVQEQEQNS